GQGHGGGASPLLRWLRGLGLTPAGTRPGGPTPEGKFVPDAIFSLTNDDIASFVAGLWDCDGFVSPSLARYRTFSERLASDVQMLLLRLGIDAVVYSAPHVLDRDGALTTAYQVTVYDGAAFMR